MLHIYTIIESQRLIRVEFAGRCGPVGAVNASLPNWKDSRSHVGRNNLYHHHVLQLRPHHQHPAIPDTHPSSPLEPASSQLHRRSSVVRNENPQITTLSGLATFICLSARASRTSRSSPNYVLERSPKQSHVTKTTSDRCRASRELP